MEIQGEQQMFGEVGHTGIKTEFSDLGFSDLISMLEAQFEIRRSDRGRNFKKREKEAVWCVSI
jgi:hypothetical protein